MCLIQPVWYWQCDEYSFFLAGCTLKTLLLIQIFHACGYVVALAKIYKCWIFTCQMVTKQLHFLLSRQHCHLHRNQYMLLIFQMYFMFFFEYSFRTGHSKVFAMSHLFLWIIMISYYCGFIPQWWLFFLVCILFVSEFAERHSCWGSLYS